MCTKISVASPTPTTINKRFRVVLLTHKERTWDLNATPKLCPFYGVFGIIDGYYSTNKIPSENGVGLKLAGFLHTAKERYQLSDYNALQLLNFFKYNLLDASRHLGGTGCPPKMLLEIDSPWRLISASICELARLDQFATQTSFTNYREWVNISSNILICVQPTDCMFQTYASRYLRLQRTYYRGRHIWVSCVLPDKHGPFEVNGLLIPTSKKATLRYYYGIMCDLEKCLAPLVLACMKWLSARG
ncbi:GH11065 [Drosophila grimshawi]|uniref:GH11065 n=1 Tax=Drosophila grimshawi TaxID=7222 RepID=B4JCH2_DROGR|nr:GH11065 [Drosophila grimshawi]